jgi:cytochrome c-type biogenesis protein CcmH
MTLWILLTVLATVAAVWLTIPLIRRHEARADERAATLAVLNDQLADIDVQLANGTLAPGDAEGLRIEIKRRMLGLGHRPGAAARPLGQRGLTGIALGMAALVAVAATALYATMGRPGLGETAAPAAPAPAAASAEDRDRAQIATLIGRLEAKVAANPKEPEGWRMLGMAYYQLGRFAEAAGAYGKSAAIKPDTPGLQSALGEAIVLSSNGQVVPDAAKAFAAAVKADPQDARARFFLALAKQQKGDARGAINDWLALLREAPADAAYVPQIRQTVEQVAAQAKIDVSKDLAALPAAGPGPSPAQAAAVQAMPAGDQQAMIRQMVDGLAARLKDNPRDEAGWQRLIRSRIVLGDKPAAEQARAAALAAFKDDAAAQARITASAREAGLE